jgi:mannose-6-phosphate isomerase-like protein (cupin superfamily)
MRALALSLALAASLGLPARAEEKPDKSGVTPKLKLPPLPPSTEDQLVARPEGAAWTPSEKSELPKGAELALIGADPVSTGPTLYLRAPGGWQLPLHTQVHTETWILIAGKATLTLDGKIERLAPGAYLVVPGKARRSFTCDKGSRCLAVVRRTGPTEIRWVEAAK